MEITELATGHYTILSIAGGICVLFAFLCWMAYGYDEGEIYAVQDIVYFQKNIPPTDRVYIVTMRIDACYAMSGWTDLILRLRGSLRDTPLILFRDIDHGYLMRGRALNVGFSVPFDIGSVMAINVAADNSDFEEGTNVFTFSDLFVRTLPRKGEILANDRTKIMLEMGKSPYTALSKGVRTWASMETLVAPKGLAILATSSPVVGKSYTVTARDAATCLYMQEEQRSLKRKSTIGFRPLNYIWSQLWPWHEAWSEYSQLDHMMVMCLDLTALLFAISCCFAFGADRLLGARGISNLLVPVMTKALGDAPATYFEEFEVKDVMSKFRHYSVILILCAYMALICSIFVIPLSLLWCRLFRLIGGKGFEKALEQAQPPPSYELEKSRIPDMSTGPEGMTEENDANCLMLRTLECHATHTASCVTSSRRLRMEPLLTNCPTGHLTARSIAYIRTKMTRLRDDSSLSGFGGLKRPDVLHESHTQSTDAPPMPLPKTAPDGSGDVVRVSRYCERLVQQAIRQIHDNSVIAECFEVAPGTGAADVTGKKKGGDKFADCCHARCCGPDGNPDESISNLTFFTEEDALSLKEMVEHMPTPSTSMIEQVTVRPQMRGVAGSDDTLDDLETEGEEDNAYEEDGSESIYDHTPLPSAKREREISPKKFSFKHAKETVAIKAYETPMEGVDMRRRIGRGVRVLPPPKAKDLETGKGEGGTRRHAARRKKGVRFDVQAEMEGRKFSKLTEMRQKKEKARPEKKDFQKVTKRFKDRSHAFRYPQDEVPFPSGRSTVVYDPVANDDWISARSNASEFSEKERLARSAPFKGNKFKTFAFVLLMLIQLGEIYMVTVFKRDENKFFLRASNGGSGPGVGRMNSAFVSCLMAVVAYPLITVHVIALLSYLMDYLHLKREDSEPYSAKSFSRPSLAPLP